MQDMKEFVAYARKLLRVINKIEKYLENGESEKALELVKELKEDTEKDVEALDHRGGQTAPMKTE